MELKLSIMWHEVYCFFFFPFRPKVMQTFALNKDKKSFFPVKNNATSDDIYITADQSAASL